MTEKIKTSTEKEPVWVRMGNCSTCGRMNIEKVSEPIPADKKGSSRTCRCGAEAGDYGVVYDEPKQISEEEYKKILEEIEVNK